MVTKVAHVTTAHARDEVRVFLKECLSLVAADYDVHMIVADGLGDVTVRGVQIHDVGNVRGRFHRMMILPGRMWITARSVNARLYHFHEPELLLIALLLQMSGAHIVYDSHEDVPRAVMSRKWIPPKIRWLVSFVFEHFENFIASRISAIIGATPHIAKRFSVVNDESVDINNYPLASEFESSVESYGKEKTVCYLGGISMNRGIFEMVNALKLVDVRLILAGPFENRDTERAVKMLPSWAKVDYCGQVSREEVRRIMSMSRAGLLFYHPDPNHVNAQPIKMFEYMSAGIPVIASKFPLWREIIEGNDCGLCVDPQNPMAIAQAIDFLVIHPERAREMGENGLRAVQTRYNWGIEEKKLLDLYKRLLN
jgi:glycosyltransferase involved in cell wall biosynthesis